MTDWIAGLTEKIETRRARVAVVGMGYVGLSLAVELAKSRFAVRGIDLDLERVTRLNRGESYLVDVASDTLAPLVASGTLTATTGFADVSTCDAIIICVPTPLRKSKEPDISFILSAMEHLGPYLRRGQLLVLESTTFPGTTEEVIQPRIEALGLGVGTDFFLAFSPERVDPGNQRFTTANIPKVVGGVTPACTALAAALYGHVTTRVFPASSPRVAETAKLLENTFRSVNIALANELSLACRRIGVDPWEVIDAAATKPFGFMPFYPGPGIGGHCIPVDPLYLSWKIRLTGYEAQFIALADQINRAMPEHVVRLVVDALNERERAVKGASLLVLGVTYKPDVNDIRESPAVEIVQMLADKGARVSYADPYVPQLTAEHLKLDATELTAEALAAADCVLVLTNHSSFDWALVADRARLVVDTRNALRAYRQSRSSIVTL
ncbi:MAG: nucleotide sugar dehydrogenase [Candidatus Rokubacteria bacterium]|nr:nucleotide sugar dehydrogenase [Candidatus Rokubacteria bacterium]